MKRENAANQDDPGEEGTKGALRFRRQQHERFYIYRAALADLEKKINNAGAKWAGIDEGKAEMKKVHDAEKELDEAKDAWKPFEKFEEKKPLRIRKSSHFFC